MASELARPVDMEERMVTQAPGKVRSEDDLRRVLSTLCNFIWTRQLRPGEHLWSIPVDQERDFDCILSDAIDELVRLRAVNSDLLAVLKDILVDGGFFRNLTSENGHRALAAIAKAEDRVVPEGQ